MYLKTRSLNQQAAGFLWSAVNSPVFGKKRAPQPMVAGQLMAAGQRIW